MEKQQTFCRICGSPAKGSAVLCIDNMFIETCLCDECLKNRCSEGFRRSYMRALEKQEEKQLCILIMQEAKYICIVAERLF